jgi:hypothetical protein
MAVSYLWHFYAGLLMASVREGENDITGGINLDL